MPSPIDRTIGLDGENLHLAVEYADHAAFPDIYARKQASPIGKISNFY
jgi:hypothetical protein